MQQQPLQSCYDKIQLYCIYLAVWWYCMWPCITPLHYCLAYWYVASSGERCRYVCSSGLLNN